MSLPLLPVSPTVANIDESFNLAVNWTPHAIGGGYAMYSGWNVYLFSPPSAALPLTYFTTGIQYGGTPSSPSFQRTLEAGDYAINMGALSSDHTQYLDSPLWDSNHTFPHALTSSLVSFSNSNLLLGQTLTITLSSLYDGSTASSWQVSYQDGTSSGWMPFSSRTVTKAFSTAGQQVITVQVLGDFSGSNPPVKLTRSCSLSVFVMNQAYSTPSETSVTGTLGVGGGQGFEIIDNTSGTATVQPYEVVARGIVRDIATNELKLLVATSRFSNASSLLGTMALDVFPLNARPQLNEPIVPLTEVTPGDSSVIPVTITTSALPSDSYIGQPAEYFRFMQATGGTPFVELGAAPSTTTSNSLYIWSAEGMPPGLEMSSDGTISGTPTQLGTYDVTVSAMDISVPPFIAEMTFSGAQAYVILSNLIITTLSIPDAQVLTPYSEQLESTGGIAPLAWSIEAGTLPMGLILDPSSGLISGVPCTYSMQDFTTQFIVTVQVRDSVGSLASRTYTMSLDPAPLQFGPLDQPVIYAGQSYRLDIPVFGGYPPYSLVSFTDDGMAADDPTSFQALVGGGGTFEFQVNVSDSNAGVHSFTVTVDDSSSGSVTKTFYYTVGEQVSPFGVVEAAFDYQWGIGDTVSEGHDIAGSLGGFLINLNNIVPISDFSRVNGLAVTVVPTGPVTLSPPSPATAPLVEVTGPPTAFCNSEARAGIPLTNGSHVVATVVREFELLTHNSVSDMGGELIYPRPYLTGDFVGMYPPRPYFNSPEVSTFPVGNSPPVPLISRVQSGSSLPPGLSLDQVTGLVYGTLTGTFGTPTPPAVPTQSASIATPPHIGATATAGVQYYVTNSNVLISVLYTGYSQSDPNLPVIKNTLAGATVGSPTVPNTTAIVDVTSNSFVMQYNYLATSAGTDAISLVQGGTVFDTVVIVVGGPALSATGLNPTTSMPASTVNGTGATLNPPVTATGGAPPYAYTLTTNAGSTTPNTFTIVNNGTANATLKVQNSAATAGNTLTWSGTIQVTDSASAMQTVTGTYTVNVVSSASPLTVKGLSSSTVFLPNQSGTIPPPVSVTGGTEPYSYSMSFIAASYLLSIKNNNTANAVLFFSGAASGVFPAQVSVTVTDSAGNIGQAVGDVSIGINTSGGSGGGGPAPLSIQPASGTYSVLQNTTPSFNALTAMNGTPPYTWTSWNVGGVFTGSVSGASVVATLGQTYTSQQGTTWGATASGTVTDSSNPPQTASSTSSFSVQIYQG